MRVWWGRYPLNSLTWARVTHWHGFLGRRFANVHCPRRRLPLEGAWTGPEPGEGTLICVTLRSQLAHTRPANLIASLLVLAPMENPASWWRRAVVAARNLAYGPCTPLCRPSSRRDAKDGGPCLWHGYLPALVAKPAPCKLQLSLAISDSLTLGSGLARGLSGDTRPGTTEAGLCVPPRQQPGRGQHGLRLRGGGDTDAQQPNLNLDPQLPAAGECGFHLLSLNMKGAALTERQAAGLDHWDCRTRSLLSTINLWQRPALIALQELGGGQASIDRLSLELRRLGYDTAARAGEETHSRQDGHRRGGVLLAWHRSQFRPTRSESQAERCFHGFALLHAADITAAHEGGLVSSTVAAELIRYAGH